MVCTACGAIQEFVDDVIEERQAMLAKQRGFVMTDHRLTIYGHCAVPQDCPRFKQCSRSQEESDA